MPSQTNLFVSADSSKVGFRDRIRMNNSRSSQTIRSKASPLPPGSNVRRSPSQENMPDSTSPGKVQKSWSFNDRTRFRTSLRLKPRPPADGSYQSAATGRDRLCGVTLGPSVASVEGVGEESMEDKPYCDVTVEEVIPAVKTLIRAVRWVQSTFHIAFKASDWISSDNILILLFRQVSSDETFTHSKKKRGEVTKRSLKD